MTVALTNKRPVLPCHCMVVLSSCSFIDKVLFRWVIVRQVCFFQLKRLVGRRHSPVEHRIWIAVVL